MKWCTKCGEAMFTIFGGGVEKCSCRKIFIIDEDGEEHSLYALDEEAAALKYAEESNTSGDYYLMNETVRITVGGKPFSISAEPNIHYSAEAL